MDEAAVPDAPGSSRRMAAPGLDDPHLPDFAAFRAARERFLRSLSQSHAQAQRDDGAHPHCPGSLRPDALSERVN